MADTKGYTINVSNERKSGAVQVTISQTKQKTIQQTINAGEKKNVKVYPGTDSLEVTALDCTKGEIITVKSTKHPDKSETKKKPPYDFNFTLDIPGVGGLSSASEEKMMADASEDNIVVVDDEED